MRDLRGRVAVVTGAASGIGLALAERFANNGMKVVLADVEAPALAAAEKALRAGGAEVLAVTTDVADAAQVDALAERALDAFGAVHVLCNNAGVAGNGGPVWELSGGEWDWILGVNLRGPINGIRTFVPILLEQDEAHIVNTASIAGLVTAGLNAYSVTKHAVVALSESLHHSLRARQARVGVSVLCPGWVRTRILDSDRNRPAGLGPSRQPTPEEEAYRELVRQLVETGMPPAEVAARVADAIREDRFYVLTHDTWTALVENRFQDILEGRPPTPLMG